MPKITVWILLPLPSWDVNSRSGTQELTACYGTRRTIIKSVLTSPLRGAVLNQVSPIHTHLTFSTSIFNNNIPPFNNILLPSGLFSFKLSDMLEFASISYFVTVQALQRSSSFNQPKYFVQNKIIGFPFRLFLIICLFRYEYYLRRPNLTLRHYW